MMCANASCAKWTVALAVVGGVAELGRAGEKVVLPGNIELRVSLADGLGNPVANRRFVHNEPIQVSGVLSALNVLESHAAVDRARAHVKRFENARPAEQAKHFEEELASAEAALARANREISRDPLRELAEQLVLTGARDGMGQASQPIEINAVRLEETQGVERTGSLSGAVVKVQWSINTDALPEGSLSLQISPRAPRIDTLNVEMEVVLVSPLDATNAERCRSQYVKAQLALDRGQYQEAVDLAGSAAELGEPLEYYRMAALHVLGDARSATGDVRNALDAYRRALDIARVAFPKSALPSILGRRIRELEGE